MVNFSYCCWYCYWGWAKPVADIYMRAAEMMDDVRLLHYGPAHVVWEDENWDSAEWCIQHFDEHKEDYDPSDLEVVRWSLFELTKLPPEIREIEPKDYDGVNPQNYPPAEGVEVVKVERYNV